MSEGKARLVSKGKFGDKERPSISGSLEREERLKAPVVKEIADVSEREISEGKGTFFVIMKTDFGTALAGRSSCPLWSAPGHMCWGHAP